MKEQELHGWLETLTKEKVCIVGLVVEVGGKENGNPGY